MATQAPQRVVPGRIWQAATGYRIVVLLAFVALQAVAADGVSSEASSEGPAQTAYAPPGGRGPVIIVISGQSGPPRYQSYAADVSRLGYYAVLVDGKDILTPDKAGAENLHKTMARAQGAVHALPGKTAVIGFSQGGGGALRHAASMADRVSVVVTYYPFTSFRAGAAALAPTFRVPVLVFAGGRDTYNNCCLIESARALEAAAKERSADFELVVYPEAEHGFTHQESRLYRRDDDRDAWRRTREMLQRHHPLP